MNKNDLVSTVNQVLIRYDLEGLMSIGAPIDEYEPEAIAIADFIINNRKATIEQLADDIQSTFIYYFSDFIDISLCIEMAEDIKEHF